LPVLVRHHCTISCCKMSKFDKAASKASGSAPAPTAKAASEVAASAPAKAAVVMTTLEEKRKFVKKQEIKMVDLEDSMESETNNKKKKEMQGDLKKLQTDAAYLKAIADIKEAEAQAIKDAERAALTAKAGDKKATAKAEEEKPAVKAERADAAIVAEIDAAFEAAGKDAAPAKEKALARMLACAASTPFMLPRLEKLTPLFDNSKLAAPAIKAAKAILEHAQPMGHGIAAVAVPILLAGISDKKWKVKAGCIELLVPCLKQMESTPAQLAQSLPLIVPRLAEAALEVRAEIRKATSAVLVFIGSLVASPEIKKLSQDLVTALAEPTNQKHTQSVLEKMGSQTFLSMIDPASLSLLMPVLVRGLKERDSMSKKWSAQIFGATSMLILDVDSMRPYLTFVMPLLQGLLSDPVPEVQREAAKAFGVLEQMIPEYSRQHNQGWLFGKLRNGEIGEQLGASLALAEVLLKMDKTLVAKMTPEIEFGACDEKAGVRRGFLELLEVMPHAMKMQVVPYITQLFPKMLMGITGDQDKDADAGLKASTSLVARFADLCPQLLLPGFEAVYAATLEAESREESARQGIIRERSSMLLGKLAEKILEHKKFGQTLLSTDDCSNQETRERLLVLMFLMRFDSDASVKRWANAAWKVSGGAAKLQKAILPAIEKMVLRMRAGELGLGMQKQASKIIEELNKSNEMEAPIEAEPKDVPRFTFAPTDRDAASVEAKIAAGEILDTTFERQISNHGGSQVAKDLITSHAAFSSLPTDIMAHCNAIAESVMTEGVKQRWGGPKIALAIEKQLGEVLNHVGSEASSTDMQLSSVSEAVARAMMGDAFDAKGGAGDDDSETLLRVENLLLMYGGGKLLLKDTVLEMKKNCRYGVIGENGAGKTTLMKEIAGHRIVGMPQELKCVHVDDSKLGLMSGSSLSVVEYCIKMAKDIGVEIALEGAKETLTSVGFDESKFNDPVAEMSTGWRMRLTLGVSMLKQADLVLLDEPTNHLDEESVEWLGNYVNTINNASVMVISHEPKFLDRICTHIMAYVDKNLEYTVGDFHAFAAAKGLTPTQIDAMLSGNLSFDTKKKEGDKKNDDDNGESHEIGAPVSGPAKLSFPIPGSVEGVKSQVKAVLETKNLSFRYSADKEFLVNAANCKLSMSSRVAICGRNGCGKSTFMTLLCSEMSPSEGKDGTVGDVARHCNLRMAYMKQDHLKALGPFFNTSSFVYISERFKDGFDSDLQKRLLEPENDEEAGRRAALAKTHGKYGLEVGELVSRTKIGSQLAYEVQWTGLDDAKQNTIEPISKLVTMGLSKVMIACDERIAAKAAGLDQRPLTRREIVRHCEAFGIDEEMCCNQQVKGFSAGQKVRLSLAAMFWTKPHFIALDEPTNYLDVETVEALAKALTNFRGGLVMIEPKTDFVEKICNEKWHMEDGNITVEKLNNGAKRAA
jgi:ATPase subunit of ABC transporter with duplicated ATPase domains